LPDAFKEQYVKDGSMLDEKWRLRAHNQYLSIAVAFGIPGLLLFISVLFYTLVNRLKKGDTLFLAFWLVAAISMFTEDTLETQAGVTFFALFYCLFLFVNPQKGDRDGISGH
jgi:O-antigen ligase